MNDKSKGPYRAEIKVSGPYRLGVPSAWAYRDGTGFETHAQIVVGDALYHVIVVVPKLGRIGPIQKEHEDAA